MVLFDISLVWFTKAHSQIDISSCRGMFKKVVQQGRSRFGERSVLVLREHGKRATCLREAASAGMDPLACQP